MIKLKHLLVAVALLFFATAATAQTFPKLTGRVVDDAHVLSPEQVAQLNQISADIEQASTRQFVVVTVPDLQGYPIEDYGYKLGRAWGIGQKGANNGIILIVAPNDRKVRIEVGYGLEPIMTDALSSMIIRDTIIPKFKAGDLPGGIVAGAQAISEQMKLPQEAAEKRAAAMAEQSKARRSRDGNIGLLIALVAFAIFFFVLPIIFARAGGRRYRSSGGLPIILWGPGGGSSWGSGGGSSWGSGGGSDWGGGGGGGFSGGGGSFGGGGSSGSW